MSSFREHWIETVHHEHDGRTVWTVKVGDEVVQVGEIAGDPSGTAGFDQARSWAEDHGLQPGGWMHAKVGAVP